MPSLIQKMKLNGSKSLCLINPPENYFNLFNQLPKEILIQNKLKGNFDQIHLFVNSESLLKKSIVGIEKYLNEKAMLWVFYPKKTSGIRTDLNRDSGWKILKEIKLRMVAFISVDEIWTAFGLRNEQKIAPRKKEPVIESFIDGKERIVNIPDDLALLFGSNKKAKKIFDELSFTNRKEYVVWILSAKKIETRQRRLAETINKLNEGKKNPSEK